MIVSTVVDLFFGLMRTVFSGLEFIGLPYEVINSLQTIMVYGTWIVGADVLAIITATIVAWWGIKLTVGLVIWIWELLPLT